tara:strand:- start:20072 stop:20512 length:441 start_codon:yes stop_codon:yes gene_type:complete
MNNAKLIKITFKTLCVMGLSFILCGNVVNGQDKKPKVEVITDDNFKKKVAKGFVLIKFTSGYQMAKLNVKLLEGVNGFEGCTIIEVDAGNARKVIKKLRIRNYPSLALFHNGSKKKVWKADMDGKVDVDNKGIKKAISNAIAGDVF